jgi:sigma-E factor negative regulatory protein RseB
VTWRTGAVLAVALVATMGLVRSSAAAPPSTVPGTDPRAQALLTRAVAAESSTAYSGVEFLSAGGGAADAVGAAAADVVDVVDVTHLPGQGTVLVEDGDDGTPARAAFSGDDTSRPNLLLELLGRSYRLVLGPSALVAGRPAEQVVAERENGAPAARFWIDAATGLLLRRDVLAVDGTLVRRSEFVQLDLGAASPRHLPAMLPALGGQPLADSALDTWRARGWPCPRVLGGLSLFDARTVPDSSDAVLHLSYSDGLSTVSVFVQAGRLDSAALAATTGATVGGQSMRARAGAPRELLWSSGGYVITVVADAPPETVAAVVAGLPHRPALATGWSRVERGLARVVSWVNPFA